MLHFESSKNLTLGVELELQLVSAESFDLTPKASEIMRRIGDEQQKIKPEIFESMIEVNTGVCRSIEEVRLDLMATCKKLTEVASDLQIHMISAGSHPFARYNERVVFPASRYLKLIDRNQYIARRLMIFGIHVHVGVSNSELAMKVNNGLLFYVPHLLALSASSPFWQGEDTGLASSRTTVFEAIPTGGHPCRFRDWSEFSEIYGRMEKSGAITSMKDIWWDIRPSPGFGTIEVRFCDGPPTLNHVLGITALIQALVARIIDQSGAQPHLLPPEEWILRENKWRASRHGLEAKIIVNSHGETGPLRVELLKLVDELAPYFERLSSTEQAAWIHFYCRSVTSYEKQREVFQKTGSLIEVAKNLSDDFKSFFQ